ncbi:hypothetical protein BE04_50425 [Sorangium cellulosum]|uniref:Secreted protein n=1 Tax=Sorangium cellulosum TaxID=56 RepID=A0A150PKP6_SORCE|nr:hypothetical protein BE04_50425 [Sorangium cellulosum]
MLLLLPRALALCAVPWPLGSCATLPSEEADEGSLPNALAGPFREIDQEELGNSRAAPHVMNDDERFARDASVVDLDGDPSTLAAARRSRRPASSPPRFAPRAPSQTPSPRRTRSSATAPRTAARSSDRR